MSQKKKKKKMEIKGLQTEKEMATHSSTLAWKTPWMEETGRLQSMGLQRVGHNWATLLSVVFYLKYYVLFIGQVLPIKMKKVNNKKKCLQIKKE